MERRTFLLGLIGGLAAASLVQQAQAAHRLAVRTLPRAAEQASGRRLLSRARDAERAVSCTWRAQHRPSHS